jgi:pyridoxal 5-phosphate dependent beta-lyase
VREHLDAGPAQIRHQLSEIGRLAREVLADVPSWEVADVPDVASAVIALRPDNQDVAATRARLLANYRILTTAGQPARAPREMTRPLLRVSPHVDCTGEDLAMLRDALTELAG